MDRLLSMGSTSATLMAHLLGYHRRDAKPEWWAYFERGNKSLDELLEDVESLAYVEEVPDVASRGRKVSAFNTLTFPEQETKLRPDSNGPRPVHRSCGWEIVSSTCRRDA
jgi:hypothetical protein